MQPTLPCPTQIGFHAYPTGGFGPFTPAPESFAGMLLVPRINCTCVVLACHSSRTRAIPSFASPPRRDVLLRRRVHRRGRQRLGACAGAWAALYTRFSLPVIPRILTLLGKLSALQPSPPHTHTLPPPPCAHNLPSPHTPLQSLVPGLPIALDESGTDMDNVLGGGAPPSDNPLYWVAGGGYFAYLWSQARRRRLRAGLLPLIL